MRKIFTAALVGLAAAMTLTVGAAAIDFTVSPAATGEILGDANGDGSINSRDILAIKRDVVNIEAAKVGADANADGKVNSRDILAIKRQIVGIEQLTDIAGSTVKILAVDGVNIKDMAIVAPAGTDPSISNSAYAASELRRYLGAATGYSRSVEYGTATTEHAIYIQYDPTMVGSPDDLEEIYPRTLEGAPGELGEDGFTIEVKDGNVYITGGRLRGCMYGVYQFLEDYLGYRFVDDTENAADTFIYPADIINLGDGIYNNQIPTFKYRHAGGSTMGSQYSTYQMARKLCGNVGMATDCRKYGFGSYNVYLNAHSWAYYRDEMWPNPDQGGDMSWNEWNATAAQYNYNWQPCFTNDYDEMFSGLLNCSDFVFTGWHNTIIPGQTRMSFSMMDNTNYCQCDNCRAIYEQIGISGAIIQFASRAADDYQAYYPGVKLYTILYDKSPFTGEVYVSSNLAIMYCGTGCNNHILGTGECGDNVTSIGGSNKLDEESFPTWSAAAGEIYFWEYGVNYNFLLAPAPCLFNIYYDIKFMCENGSDGIYYEGMGYSDYNFEDLKAYVASRVIWDPEMSFEELEYIIQEFLYIRYGDGYEAIYELICTLNDCGDAAGCWINNHDRPWEMYEPTAVAANYEKMLSLIEEAKDGARNSAQYKKVEELGLHVNFLGLCATYEDVYVNGDEAAKAQYEARYQWLWNYLTDNKIPVYSQGGYDTPKTCNLDTNPMEQFFESGYTN